MREMTAIAVAEKFAAAKEQSLKLDGRPLPESVNHRFQLADLADLAPWLLGRLKEKYVANERALMDFLRGMILSPEHCFLRSENAVACARIVRDPLQPWYAEEVFVFCKPGCEDEAAGLYEPMRRWAQSMDLEDFRVMVCSDVDKKRIAMMLGRVFMREMYLCRVVRAS